MGNPSIERVGDMYIVKFSDYSEIIDFLKRKQPSQFSYSFDGETLKGSFPVQAKSLKVYGNKNG